MEKVNLWEVLVEIVNSLSDTDILLIHYITTSFFSDNLLSEVCIISYISPFFLTTLSAIFLCNLFLF